MSAIKPDMKVEAWPIERVIPYDNNAKRHADEQVAGIAENIKKFGFDQPIVVDKDGVIIKGHGRRLAAIKLGLKRVPVVVAAHLSKAEANAARLTDNRVASTDYDTKMLQEEMAALSSEFDLGALGFSDKELDFLTADVLELDEDVLVDDMEESVAAQAEENEEKAAAVDASDVGLDKAFGFKAVPTTLARRIKAFIARIEEETGKTGPAALDAFLETAGI
jgi:ParB-like chromosome segregation protein Spo0J